MGKHYEEYLRLKKEREKSEKRKLKKWDEKNFLSFNLSRKDFSHAVMGWCKFLIRPYLEPYIDLKVMDYIYMASKLSKMRPILLRIYLPMG